MEAVVVRREDYLENLPGKLVINIKNELSKNGAYIKLAENLKSRRLISDEECARSISSTNNFFEILVKKSLRVGGFQKLMKDCQIYDILRVINTKDPVQILHPLEDSVLLKPLGERVSMSVDVCGSPFPELQWCLDGIPLIGKNAPELVLEEFSMKDVGQYTCRIKQRLDEGVSEVVSRKYILNARKTSSWVPVDRNKAQKSTAYSENQPMLLKPRGMDVCYTARNKWALLIGNAHYPEMDMLPGSKEDIHIMMKNYVELGFRVMMFSDLERTAIRNAVKHFSEFLQEGDYVAVFYGGHGIHSDGKDYIIPVDATVKYLPKQLNICYEEQDLSIDECISFVWITNMIQQHKPALIYVIYDTCRTMKLKDERSQSRSSQESYQTPAKNFFSIFATSENYSAYENSGTSLLVNVLQNLMVCKMSVQDLSFRVLQEFNFTGETDDGQIQVPKIVADLALPLSLADPSQPLEVDELDSGVLKKWERLAGDGVRMQNFIRIADIQVEANVYWDMESRKDGVTWVISNCLNLTVNLSQYANYALEEIDVAVKLYTGKELLKHSLKLNHTCSVQFLVTHLQDLEDILLLELYFTYRACLFQEKIYVRSPAISRQFFKGNFMD